MRLATFVGIITKASLVTILLVGKPGYTAPLTAEERAAQLRANHCDTCHGVSGDSGSDTVPRLNGQNFEYLISRLDSFRYPIRESPRAIHEMGMFSTRLDGKVIGALARFYAQQAPPATGQKNTEGTRLYQKGAKDIPGCLQCHGVVGQGRGAVPRLAGQHKGYLLIQLRAFSTAARIGDPMNHHVWVMTPQQAEAIAAYLGN